MLGGGIMVSGCPVQAPTSPHPIPTAPLSLQKAAPREDLLGPGTAEQLEASVCCWQLAPRVEAEGEVGLGTGQQPELPQVPQHTGLQPSSHGMGPVLHFGFL